MGQVEFEHNLSGKRNRKRKKKVVRDMKAEHTLHVEADQ